jgi:pyruvate dehydrogenase E2 component (dihydrolipoamide acetyltransferase)
MPVPVIISKATISMEEGVILKWFKTEGEAVGEEEVLFEMETDKAVVEVGAPVAGVLLRILAAEGTVKVGSVVGWIGQPGDSIEEAAGVHPPVAESGGIATARSKAESRPARILATPAARRRAAELGVALESVQSSTPGGRIERKDVERAAAMPVTEKSARQLGDRKPLIQRLVTTWQSVPHIHVARLLDAKGLMEAKKRLAGTQVSITDLLLHIMVLLLPRFPELTMVWEGDKLVRAVQTNLAFAVDTDRGVVAPVISAADALGLEERSKKRHQLTEAAHAHRLRPEEMQGGVFTLTNLGMQGVDFFAPLINAPQTAILATGRIRQEPVVADGVIAMGWRMWVNLAVDHRVADGMAAARFLEQLQIEVEQLSKTLDANS